MTLAESAAGAFTASLGCLIEPALAGLATQLGGVAGLAASERDALHAGLRPVLYDTVHRKVSRVLLLELNAARVTGRLTAADPTGRFDQFTAMSAQRAYWESLAEHYPTMLARIDTAVANRCAAAVRLAHRFAADRPRLRGLLDDDPGPLVEVTYGVGDTHRGGETVAILRCAAGTVVYKPRPVDVDVALGALLADLAGLADVLPATGRIAVPRTLARPGYGWVEHVGHRYCADETELAAFYRALGHWLAVMRLLGGVDLHAENVIAHGPSPVVVDCEALFTPEPRPRPSGLGRATDEAGDLIENTVLRIGLLPGRGLGLGWRGVDASAIGGLPGEQPVAERPVIVDEGTDTARLGTEVVAADLASHNHPSPHPVLDRHWNNVLAGFEELTAHLVGLDRAGRLAPLLDRFRDCTVRVVVRDTESYAELERMLWHPVSLHDPQTAVERAAAVMAEMAQRLPHAPGSIEVITAEIEDLLDGDVPVFTTTPRSGVLAGPRGTACMPERDLVDGALRRWRAMDLTMERRVIRAALVSAYLNDGWLPPAEDAPAVPPLNHDGLDRRRRAVAADIMRRLADHAIVAGDGTATWIAAVLNPTGWAVQPLAEDLYGGIVGVSVLLAAYRHETRAGRADPVDGLDDLLAGALRTVRAAEDHMLADRTADFEVRPPPPGGYIGLGSQIWAWLLLDRFGAAGPDGLHRAAVLADLVPAAVEVDAEHTLLLGRAGAIVPLLGLAARTGESRFVDHAVAIGVSLVEAAQTAAPGCFWPAPRWPNGLGGLAHGSTGIGWALARLAEAVGDERFARTAAAAAAFEEAQYIPALGGWRDLREGADAGTANAWCHGSVGIGLVALDLGAAYPNADDVVRRAAHAAWTHGVGWNHTVCHGDLGVWELLAPAIAAGLGPAGLTRADLDARIVGGLEADGPVSGLNRETFAPGLLPGVGGIAYQLLRMDPAGDLPSVLMPGRPT